MLPFLEEKKMMILMIIKIVSVMIIIIFAMMILGTSAMYEMKIIKPNDKSFIFNNVVDIILMIDIFVLLFATCIDSLLSKM